ncbi:uncharacterized protein LOC108090091 [Drosophila ficusphila]|uniref:uncharacterized protein LOC108090091 n=1 Tax=Drosophila ficusphila TaxID=30025 RepID=UPI0007E8B02C|nr:uncharacterized protein LOC108090091 [Drosophila ficusphila]XP_017044082.1 uncharacterized protein LOC108090091 [Drosophila ficusphila]
MGRKRRNGMASSSHEEFPNPSSSLSAEGSKGHTDSSASDFGKRPRSGAPEKASRQDRKHARRILRQHRRERKRLDMVSKKELTKNQQEIAWAHAVLGMGPFIGEVVKPDECQEQVESPGEIGRQETPDRENPVEESHRSRRDEPDEPEESPERSRSPSPEYIIKVGDNRKLIAVINRNDVLGALTVKAWHFVQSALAKVASEVFEEFPGPPPKWRDSGWFQGVIKVIVCDNNRSVALYKTALSKVVALYPGTQLEVHEAGSIPIRPRALGMIPSEPSTAAEILRLIRLFNPRLPTQNWRVVSIKPCENGQSLVGILLNEECLQPLKECGGRLEYGFNQITLQICETDVIAPDNLASCFDPLNEEDDDKDTDSKFLTLLGIN